MGAGGQVGPLPPRTIQDHGLHGPGRGQPGADRLQGLLQVKRPGPALFIQPVPVVEAVGDIVVLLDLEQQQSGADGVDQPAGDEQGLPGPGRKAVQ